MKMKYIYIQNEREITWDLQNILLYYIIVIKNCKHYNYANST
jgi:hypothetical protein